MPDLMNRLRLIQSLLMGALLTVCGTTALAADPGAPAPSSANVSGMKLGSALFYNLYSSSVSPSANEDTELSITNTGAAVAVRIFLVSGANGAALNETRCLGANQTVRLLASRVDPGVSGYAFVVAVDRATGCPISHNFLAGDAYVKLATGHFARLNAVAIAANFSGPLPACNPAARTTAIVFDGGGAGYNRVPRALAVNNITSRADGNATLVVINRVGGDLTATANSIGAVSGALYDGDANEFGFNATIIGSQFKSILRNNSFPPIEQPFDVVISAGRSGWMKLWAQSDVGLLGAALNSNFNSGADGGAFNGGENLRALTLATTSSFIIPVSAINCPGAVASVSAASFSGAALASESIVAAFGSGLATRIEAARTLPLPLTMAGTTVEVRDGLGVARLAPLFYTAPMQVNYQMPPGTAQGPATIKISSGAGVDSFGSAQVAAVAPGMFSANSSGQGVAAAVALRVKAGGAQSYEPIAALDPAQGGFVALPIDLGPNGEQVFLILFATGIRGRSSLSATRVRIGGVESEVVYAGEQGVFAGLDQLNVRAPRNLAGRGEVDVVVAVDNQSANTVRVRFK